MNTASDILSYAKTHDIRLNAEDGQLKIDAPENELTDEFLESAKQHKSEILEALTKKDSGLMVLVSEACSGLEITPTQFTALCNEDDLKYIRNGAFSIKTLRAYAKSFADGISTRRIVFHPRSHELVRHN